MNQVGRVIKKTDGFVVLEVIRKAACGADCSSCKGGCENKKETIEVIDTLGLKEGDFVELTTSSKNFISYISLVYGLPLLFFLIGATASYKFLPLKDENLLGLLSFVIGIILTVICYLIVRKIDSRTGHLSVVSLERKL